GAAGRHRPADGSPRPVRGREPAPRRRAGRRRGAERPQGRCLGGRLARGRCLACLERPAVLLFTAALDLAERRRRDAGRATARAVPAPIASLLRPGPDRDSPGSADTVERPSRPADPGTVSVGPGGPASGGRAPAGPPPAQPPFPFTVAPAADYTL